MSGLPSSLAPIVASRNVPSPNLAIAELFGGAEAVFAVKSFAAAMLAYWFALLIGLDKPSWAIVTSLIVAQPLAGAVLSKAVFRLIGTFAGASVAVLVVPTLVNAPVLLSVAFAAWLGLCTYLGVLDRTPRSYLFLLAGYTAAIVGFPAVSTPDAIFSLASVRMQEIVIGILAAATVHSIVLPRSVSAQVASQIDRMLHDAERLSAAIVQRLDREVAGDRIVLIRDLGALDALAVHLAYDRSDRAMRPNMLHAIQHQMAEALALSSAVEDRLHRLGGNLPTPVAEYLQDMGKHLLAGDVEHDDHLMAQADLLEPAALGVRTFDEALILSLLDRSRRLIAAHRLTRQLARAFDNHHASRSAEVREALSEARRPRRHRDRFDALLGAGATTLAVLIGCAWWIATGWPDGATAVVYAGMICALFSHLADPGRTLKLVIGGVAVGAAVAFTYRFAIIPQITAFEVLIAVLAPSLLLLSTLGQQPGFGGFAVGATLAFPGLAGLDDRYTGNLSGFANSATAELAGALIATLSLALVRGAGGRSRATRFVRTSRSELVRRLHEGERRTTDHWTGTMLDRVGLIAATDDDGEHVVTLLHLLRLGRAVRTLRGLAVGGGRQRSIAALLLRHLGDALSDPRLGPRARRFFFVALPRLARDGEPDARRAAILAVVAVICNLPADASQNEADNASSARWRS